MRVLVTGGAGFIGSHLSDELLKRGHSVRVIDNLEPQVHGIRTNPPPHLSRDVEFIRGDIRDSEKVKKAIKNVDWLYHLAASVGIGQSMYEITKYVDVNSLGCAKILEVVALGKNRVRKMIVASSMSCYGEGKYYCQKCSSHFFPKLRTVHQLKKKQWEPFCPQCSSPLKPVPTDEEKPLFPTSVYAITKRDHEEMFLNVGRAYKIPTVALRFFNVYGSRQSLSNPYTGVAAIFSCRLLSKKKPVIFEDGEQLRDFVHISDILQALTLSSEKNGADYNALNVGTGVGTSVIKLLHLIGSKLTPQKEIKATFSGKFREGDIRHCYADTTRIKDVLGYSPKVSIKQGIEELVNWVKSQTPKDIFLGAMGQLRKRGLII